MLKFSGPMLQRDKIVERLKELTGIWPYYAERPFDMYFIGRYAIDRHGNIYIETDDVDRRVIQALTDEDLIHTCTVVEVKTLEKQTTKIELLKSDAPDRWPESLEEHDGTVHGKKPASEKKDEIDLNMDFPVPLEDMNGNGLRNFVYMLYTRASLINKATGSRFSVKRSLVDFLRDDSCTYAIANFLHAMQRYEEEHGTGIKGITIDKEHITFSGFPKARDIEQLTAFGKLAVLMTRHAAERQRIQAKKVDESNEKYAMRLWLVQLGMNGDEFKRERQILMERLTGNTTYHLQEQVEAQKQRRAQRRSEEAEREKEIQH